MKIQRRKKSKKLVYQIAVYFMSLLLIFSCLIALIYIGVYKKNTTRTYQDLLSQQVENISEHLSQYVISEDYSDYAAYLEMLKVSVYSDVWIIKNPEAVKPMDDIMVNIEGENEELTVPEKTVIKKAFQGDTNSTTGYNKICDSITMMMAAPIYNEEQDVVGAIVLVSPITQQEDEFRNVVFLFGMSVLISLGVSFLLALKFAKHLSWPITKIGKTALSLSEGHYEERTKIKGSDEIAELAKNVDILAAQLEENEKHRNDIEQMRMDFFANVSHELRTPMTVLRGYVESLVDGVVTDEGKQKQCYDRMLLECKGMERLIQDLLILAKMENPHFKLELEPVDLLQVLEDVIRSVKIICKEKNIELIYEKDCPYAFCLGDYDRLRQMFLAVVDNAVKFSKEGHKIYLNARGNEQDHKVYISIRDEGIGMDEEELSKIFSKFYTSKISNNKDGTGLGLMIAKEIANKHGGVIEAKSKKNEGSTFIFKFNTTDIPDFY